MKTTDYISYDIYRRREIWRHAAAGREELDALIKSLRRRQKIFQELPVGERLQAVAALGSKLAAKRTSLAAMICEEVGRCQRECLAEIDKTIRLIAYYTELAPLLLQPKKVPTAAGYGQISYEPLGLILAVMPWNYPIWQLCRFAVPALCAGNGCLIKPAPGVGRVTAAFFELIAGDLPFNYILAADADLEDLIAAADGVAFTGSVATGKIIAAAAGRQLKKTVLELGGSNAFIVLKDADLRQAAVDACHSRFRDAGQSCNAAKRIIVEEDAAAPFIKYLLAETAKIKCGDPRLAATVMGPLYAAGAPRHLQNLVDEAVDAGAVCLAGGTITGKGSFYPPTVVDKVNPESRIVQEEVFGPVLPVLRAQDAAHAVALANASVFGLGAAIYSRDLTLAATLARQLQVGSVYINRHNSSHLQLPFGGVKNSGYGRELSEFGLIEFVNIKSYWQS